MGMGDGGYLEVIQRLEDGLAVSSSDSVSLGGDGDMFAVNGESDDGRLRISFDQLESVGADRNDDGSYDRNDNAFHAVNIWAVRSCGASTREKSKRLFLRIARRRYVDIQRKNGDEATRV